MKTLSVAHRLLWYVLAGFAASLSSCQSFGKLIRFFLQLTLSSIASPVWWMQYQECMFLQLRTPLSRISVATSFLLFFFFANTLVFSGHHIRPWYDHAKQQKRFLYIINSFDYLLFLQHLMDSFSYIHISNISAECGCVNSTVLKANSEINFVPNWKILQ